MKSRFIETQLRKGGIDPNMLELKGIKKDYLAGENTVHALKGIDLRFRRNEFVSILGPSGCGKTTMLNIIGGLDQYTEGDLVINGRSTKDFKDRDWDTYRNHSIGFVFQSYNLIPHQTVLLVDDSIVRGTQLRETVDFLYGAGAKEVHMRSACPPIMFSCKYLSFSSSKSEMDLISRRVIQELEGDEGQKHLEEYADSSTERGKCMLRTICEKLGFDSLGYQSLDGMLEGIGIDPSKVCTYCWTGKE